MVLEHIFPDNWLENKIRYAFIIAVVYSTVGILISRFLFGANSGIASIVFVSLLIIPYLQKMFNKEEMEEEREKRYRLHKKKSFFLFFKNNQVIRVYFAIFLGIYLTYLLYTFIMPQIGFNVSSVFREQLAGEAPMKGNADIMSYNSYENFFYQESRQGTVINELSNNKLNDGIGFSSNLFFSILINNWWVLLACFLLSIIIGDGGIFFIAWNASAWGSALGYRALTAGMVSGESSWMFLLMIVLITLPHLILEGLSYVLASISGGIISDEIIKERSDIKNFLLYMAFGFLFILFLKYMIGFLLHTSSIAYGFISMISVLGMLYLVGWLFEESKLKKVFITNYHLFILALILFILGAIVETFVLQNSDSLNRIYALSFMAG